MPGTAATILSCQGSVQLVTAIAAARAAGGLATARDSLVVIHDLCAPVGQDEDFALALEQLAEALQPGIRCTYLRPYEIHGLNQLVRSGGFDAGVTALQARLGVKRVESLFLAQRRLLLNDLLALLDASARKHCYGDAVGVNFSDQYFATPSRPGARALFRAWRHALQSALRRTLGGRRGNPRTRTWSFDEHCLLLANRFDQALPHYTQLDPAVFRELFQQCGQWLQRQPRGKANSLPDILAWASQTTFLLSTNFSEAGRMSEENELAAYCELLAAPRTSGRGALVVKPHPRDSAAKIARLTAALAGQFDEITVLDDPYSFYVPFESIFSNLFLTRPDWLARARIVCVSSACLPLELLYGAPCKLGFGPDIVRRRFLPHWVPLRLRHEQDLEYILAELRSARPAAA